jgi:hypothetical protein
MEKRSQGIGEEGERKVATIYGDACSAYLIRSDMRPFSISLCEIDQLGWARPTAEESSGD